MENPRRLQMTILDAAVGGDYTRGATVANLAESYGMNLHHIPVLTERSPAGKFWERSLNRRSDGLILITSWQFDEDRGLAEAVLRADRPIAVIEQLNNLMVVRHCFDIQEESLKCPAISGPFTIQGEVEPAKLTIALSSAISHNRRRLGR